MKALYFLHYLHRSICLQIQRLYQSLRIHNQTWCSTCVPTGQHFHDPRSSVCSVPSSCTACCIPSSSAHLIRFPHLCVSECSDSAWHRSFLWRIHFLFHTACFPSPKCSLYHLYSVSDCILLLPSACIPCIDKDLWQCLVVHRASYCRRGSHGTGGHMPPCCPLWRSQQYAQDNQTVPAPGCRCFGCSGKSSGIEV